MTDTKIKLRFGPAKETKQVTGTIDYQFMMDGSAPSPIRFIPNRPDYIGYWVNGRGTSYIVNLADGSSYGVQFTIDDRTRELPPKAIRQLEYIEFKYSLNVIPRPRTQGARSPGLALTRAGLRMNYPFPPVFQPPRPRREIKVKPLELYDPEYIAPTLRGTRTAADWINFLNQHRARFTKRRERVRRLRSDRFERLTKLATRTTIRNAEALAKYKIAFQKRVVKYEQRKKAYDVALERSKRPQFVKGDHYDKDAFLPDHKFKLMKLVPLEQPKYVKLVGARAVGSWPPVDMYGRYRFSLTGDYAQRNDPFSNGGMAPDFYRMNPFGGGSWPYATEHGQQWSGFREIWNDGINPDIETLLSDEGFMHSLHSQIADAADFELEEDDTKLIRKIYSKIRRNVMHVGNMVAERKQTFDLIVSTAKRIQKLISLKRSALSAAGKAAMNPKTWANDILAFKFGVEPLINDFQSLCDFLQSSDPDSLKVVVRTNTGKDPRPLVFDRNGIRFEGTYELSYVVKLKATNEIFNSLNSFGLINPAEILWEVTPWSFVVDWFVPVGQWIASLTADLGLQFITGTRKVKLKGVFTIGGAGYNPKDPTYTRARPSGIRGRFAGEFVSRTVMTHLPDRMRILSVKNPWSWSHGIEALSLFVQKVKK